MKNVGFCALSELDQKIGPNFPKHSKGRNQTMVFFMSCSRWRGRINTQSVQHTRYYNIVRDDHSTEI